MLHLENLAFVAKFRSRFVVPPYLDIHSLRDEGQSRRSFDLSNVSPLAKFEFGDSSFFV